LYATKPNITTMTAIRDQRAIVRLRSHAPAL
jgi:hypothetical protein